MTNLLEKIKRGMQWLFNDQARFAAALILLMFLVVGVAMLAGEARASESELPSASEFGLPKATESEIAATQLTISRNVCSAHSWNSTIDRTEAASANFNSAKIHRDASHLMNKDTLDEQRHWLALFTAHGDMLKIIALNCTLLRALGSAM